MITTNQYYQIINVFYKSVLLYQSIPGYITGELSIKNIQEIDNMMTRKLLNTPPGVPTALVKALYPFPTNTSWFMWITGRIIEKLKSSDRLHPELEHTKLKVNTLSSFWTLGTNEDKIEFLKKLWWPQIIFTVIQVTANQFEWDISKDPWKCPWGEYFTKEHRIRCDKVFTPDMRIFSTHFFIKWMDTKQMKENKVELLRSSYLQTKEKLIIMKNKASKTGINIKLPHCKPNTFIDLEKIPAWIEQIYQKGMKWNNIAKIKEGEEWRDFINMEEPFHSNKSQPISNKLSQICMDEFIPYSN